MSEKQSKLEEKSDKILNAILETKEQNSQTLTACQNSINSNISLKAEVETLTSSVNNLLKSIREVVREEINQTWSHKEAEIDLKITTSKNDILNYVSNNFVSKNAQNFSAYNNTYANNSHYSNHQNNNQSSSNTNNSMSY
jgi:polyribonucleotide nucleotidyltransferase